MARTSDAPRFSVILPCLDDGRLLERTIESLRAQTFKDFEVLLVDALSHDGTAGIMDGAVAADRRFRAFRGPSRNCAAARNMARGLARGDFLAFCEPGDLFEPHKLAILDQALCDSTVDGAYGEVLALGARRGRAFYVLPDTDLSIGQLLGANPLVTLSNLCVRRGAFLATGSFDTGLAHGDELEWLIRLVGHGFRITPVEAPLTRFGRAGKLAPVDLASLRVGRAASLRTAARYGVHPTPADEAIQLRSLAWSALRQGSHGFRALGIALDGLRISPRGFFAQPATAIMTLAGGLVSSVLPPGLRRVLFTI